MKAVRERVGPPPCGHRAHDGGGRALAVAVVRGVVMITVARRVPKGDFWLSGYLTFGTVLITLVIALNHSKASPYALACHRTGSRVREARRG